MFKQPFYNHLTISKLQQCAYRTIKQRAYKIDNQ